MDRTVDLTIAALIFLAGTAGLVSGEDIGGVETTNDIDGESAEAASLDARYLRGDANDDGSFDISDPVTLLAMLFTGSGDLPPPGPQDCGLDPTADVLDCESFNGCP